MAEPHTIRRVAPLALQPLRWASVLSVSFYYRVAYRIRGWGGLPRRRGPTLLIANHQHEIESAVLISDLTIATVSWRYPIFTVSSRRMWEPGFFAERIAWLSPVLRSLNFGWLFSSLGLQPIENELHVRPFASVAYELMNLHGDLEVGTVFTESARKRLPASVKRIGDLLRANNFIAGRSRVKLNEVSETYRKELMEQTRAQLETDLQHFENLQREGATIFLAPEGFYSGDGKMQRLRGSLSRLAPLAQIWLAGISYDPLVGRRLSMLYRIGPAVADVAFDLQLKRLRPVTTSALLGTWLHERAGAPFTEREAQAAVESLLAVLPSALFVEPELRADPPALTLRALEGLIRLGMATKDGATYRLTSNRTHAQFPRTNDIIEYLYNFHAETMEGSRSV
jgi:1-acyl-sn-glycerol-3-phosphate acyltransferase